MRSTLACDPTDNGPALRWPKTLKPRCEAMVGGGWQWHPSGPRPRAATVTVSSHRYNGRMAGSQANMAVVWLCGRHRFVTVCLSWRLVDQSLPTTSFGGSWPRNGLPGMGGPRAGHGQIQDDTPMLLPSSDQQPQPCQILAATNGLRMRMGG